MQADQIYLLQWILTFLPLVSSFVDFPYQRRKTDPNIFFSNYATKPIRGGIDSTDGGSGIGLVML